MHRFRVDAATLNDGLVYVTGDQFNRLKRVLRLGVGDRVAAFDGSGMEYRAVIREMLPGSAKCAIVEQVEVQTESPIRVVLVQGIPKGDKLELVIQKSTELGVSGIIPVITSRTVVRVDPDRSGRKLERWQSIAAEAARQCRRAVIPVVGPIMTWFDAVNAAEPRSLLILPWEEERSTGLKAALKAHAHRVTAGGAVYILVGPEGGLSAEEVVQAAQAGAISVSLGPRILRTETAGVVTLAAVMYELGDLGGAIVSD